MPKYASGRFAKRISDRSGLAFPYNEMVKEWNGSTVHISEFEPKHPQLDPRYHPTDPQSLQNARGQTIDATVDIGVNLFATNIFGTVQQTITQFNPIPSPGAFETVIVNTMQPEESNKEVKMNSFVGRVTVSIS
mgnify:FL=1|tara:strand:+ start:208 stop:609 length:402 start_codon:yes stop_codon:yes gene_type:complete